MKKMSKNKTRLIIVITAIVTIISTLFYAETEAAESNNTVTEETTTEETPVEEATQEEIVTMLGNISMTQIVSRGGNYKDKSPIAERTATSTYNNNYCGFRVAFYV